MAVIVRRSIAGVPMALLLLVGSGAIAAEPGPVLLTVEGNGDFEVLDKRVQSTGEGPVISGLVGSGDQESSHNQEDRKRKEEIRPFIPDGNCRDAFVSALAERLEEKGFEVVIVGGDAAPVEGAYYDLQVEIRSCGFMLTNSTSALLSAFHAATYSVRTGNDEMIRKTDILITGRMTAKWPDILANAQLAAEEFSGVREKSGRRIANQLIYHDGGVSTGAAL